MTGKAIPSRVLVTGGGRGIGAAVARALIEAGARVTLLGRDAGRLGRRLDRPLARHVLAVGSQTAEPAAGAPAQEFIRAVDRSGVPAAGTAR